MRKFLCLVLAITIIAGIFSVTSVAADNDMTVTVVSDVHYNYSRTNNPVAKRNSISTDFAHIEPGDLLPAEGYAILSAFLKAAGENESNCIIIPGDLADTGSKQDATAVAAILRDFEKTYKKQVYVVPGNHDLLKMSVEEFEAIFAEFGYNEALASDPKTGSYTVDLKNGYRLIAIDSCYPGDGRCGLDTERVNWIKEQCNKAKSDGKKAIAMMHHNMLEHFILGRTIHSKAIVDESLGLADILAKSGVKYIFTGHTHDSDIISYTADDGSVVYDVVTATLLTNSCPYRVVTFGENVKFETRHVDKIDTSLLPQGISENALKLAEENFSEYSRVATWVGLEAIFRSYVSAKGFKNLLKLEDEAMNAIIDKVGDKLAEAIMMPFNKADETEEGKSIESIAKKYSAEIPETDYKNLIDLAITFYEAHNLGDENFPAHSDEVVLVTRGLATALGYALEDVTAEEYATVMSFLVGLADVKIPVDFFVYAGDGIKRMEGIEIYVLLVLVPLVREFGMDKAPGDNNVTLSGYAVGGENAEKPEGKSFWDKIMDFFNRIFEAIKTIFVFLPNF